MLDPIGSAQWLAMPGLEEPFFFALELDGVGRTFRVTTGDLRAYLHDPDAPLDDLTVYLQRKVDTGECVAFTSSISGGGSHVTGDVIGFDSLPCGDFGPSCAQVRADIENLVEGGKACGLDSDCLALPAPCGSAESCCHAYVNNGAHSAWLRSTAYARGCARDVPEFGGCSCSCSAPPPPRCIDGRCVAGSL